MSDSSAFEVAIVHSYFGSPSTLPSTYVSRETLRDRETRVASSGEVRVNPAALKHRGTGIDPLWKNDLTWLETWFDESGEPGMWSSLCKHSSCKPKRAALGKAAWIEDLCRTIIWLTLTEHLQSDCHNEAMHVLS